MATFLIYVSSPLIIAFFYNLISRKSVNNSQKSKKLFLIFCGVVIWFMIGMRHYSVGSGDGKFYYNNWIYMSKISFSDLSNILTEIDLEIGYLLAVWLFSHIFSNPQFLFIISGLFFAFAICYFVFKNSEDVVLSLIIFNCLGLFIFMVQGLRQSLAICICLFAIEKCKKRQLIPFLLLVVIAATFHASALIFVLVYPLYKLSLNLKDIFIFVVISVIGVIALPYLFDLFNYFLNDDYSINGVLNDGTGGITILIYASIIVVALLFKTKENASKDASKEYAFFFYAACIGFFCLVMRNYVSPIIQRVAWYFMFGQMAIVPLIIKNFKKPSDKQILTAIITTLFLILAIHKATYSPVVPYLFFWQGV